MSSFEENWLFIFGIGQFSTLLCLCNEVKMLILLLTFTSSFLYNKFPIQLFLEIKLHSFQSEGEENYFLFFNKLSIMHGLRYNQNTHV